MLYKKIPVTVFISLALVMGGCSTLKGKKADEAANQNYPQGQGVQDANSATGADTNALSEQERLKAEALAEQQRAAEQQRTVEQQRVAEQERLKAEAANLLATRLVHFDYDSADLSGQDQRVLQAHAQYLKANTSAKVLLAGHADERGTREYNMALGERRANAVQAFFVSNGVKSSQLDTVSFGKEKPLNNGTNESAWAENRRVEIGYQQGAPR
ncbi:MAG: peptidoglycan-associated lipoprotein Pal [Moraxellaceae bacterium]|nr:peptidoglycan-associated lipoprotein Pal [Moraxellaceae bacterium]